MDAETFRKRCLAKAQVTEGTPFGEDHLVFKVAGKVFAILALDEIPPRVNLKCDPDRALELRDRYEQVQPGYHMNKKHWNTVIMDAGMIDSAIIEMLDHSYELVRAKAAPRTKSRAKKTGRARLCRAKG
ncbi:MAG: MmcQ/YjbR family DNA-binding protein [Verrucomicrobiota bacterium]|nr:MmcQ/YjbR family DNA-binding protein [Verrucomicrobiota bacterium]